MLNILATTVSGMLNVSTLTIAGDISAPNSTFSDVSPAMVSVLTLNMSDSVVV